LRQGHTAPRGLLRELKGNAKVGAAPAMVRNVAQCPAVLTKTRSSHPCGRVLLGRSNMVQRFFRPVQSRPKQPRPTLISLTARMLTKIEPDRTFYPAEGYHQDFLARNPSYPYIAINDVPKIESLKRLFPEFYRSHPVLVAADALKLIEMTGPRGNNAGSGRQPKLRGPARGQR
jgi:Peptide methionine sulfoxide reductase